MTAMPSEPYPGALVLLGRLGLAVALGGALGFEREWHGKPAGLRTHMMVALGASCFTLLALGLSQAVSPQATPLVRVDPTRAVHGVVTGIGFLGAGAILRRDGGIEGLTTAGGIWLVGAVGSAVGAGYHLLAIATTALALVVLQGLGRLEHGVLGRRHANGTKDRPEDEA